MVGQDAVELLGHPQVEGAHARLDVDDGDAGLSRRQASCQGRVRVAVDEHRVGLLGGEERLERAEHAGGLRGVGGPGDIQLAVGPGQAELAEEDL